MRLFDEVSSKFDEYFKSPSARSSAPGETKTFTWSFLNMKVYRQTKNRSNFTTSQPWTVELESISILLFEMRDLIYILSKLIYSFKRSQLPKNEKLADRQKDSWKIVHIYLYTSIGPLLRKWSSKSSIVIYQNIEKKQSS